MLALNVLLFTHPAYDLKLKGFKDNLAATLSELKTKVDELNEKQMESQKRLSKVDSRRKSVTSDIQHSFQDSNVRDPRDLQTQFSEAAQLFMKLKQQMQLIKPQCKGSLLFDQRRVIKNQS
jgi:ppGpp synthetase/RelA/SpoT-type nucleotidyltranferase